MSAKILMFDPNRRVPPRRYTPIAMRGRLLRMPKPRAKSVLASPPREGFHCDVFMADPMRRPS